MLPSQSPRPVGLRSSSGRPRRRGLPIGRIVVVLGVIVGGWFTVKALLPVGETNAQTGDDDTAVALKQDEDQSTAGDAASAVNKNIDVGDRSRNNAASAGNDDAVLAIGERQAPTVTQPQTNINANPARPDGDADQLASNRSADTNGDLIMGGTNLPGPPAPTVDSDPVPSQPVPSKETPPSTLRTAERVQKGLELIKANRLVDGRLLLSRALASGSLSQADAQYVRKTLTDLNERLVFSPEVVADDEYTLTYTIGGGDVLERIVKRMALQVNWRFIQRVNRIEDPRSIQAGDRLKLVTGPFHAVVDKSDYTLDLYLGEGDTQVYVRTFPVGLGEFNSTPVGLFRIRPRSKLVNPEWINPRTRERYAADDPNNPIGERWLGLEGISDAVRDVSGYGIHGTIEPDSIGQQASMGCVRMHHDDVAIIYEVLIEGASTVRIQD